MSFTDPICPHCGMPCEVVTEDVGVGVYEYEGQKGSHTQIVEFSVCCQVEIDGGPLSEDDLYEIKERDLR